MRRACYARDRSVLVVAMGRGGPAKPEVAEAGTSLDRLLELAERRASRRVRLPRGRGARGRGHDRLPARRRRPGRSGCRPRTSPTGARLAVERGRRPRPLRGQRCGDATHCHRPAGPRRRRVDGPRAAHRLPQRVPDPRLRPRRADERRGRSSPTAAREAITAVKDVPVVATVMRPRPATARDRQDASPCSRRHRESAHSRLADHLRREHDVDVVHISGNLANRDALRDELKGIKADVYLIEIKAAAIDVVADDGSRARRRVRLRRQPGSAALGRAGSRRGAAGSRRGGRGTAGGRMSRASPHRSASRSAETSPTRRD